MFVVEDLSLVFAPPLGAKRWGKKNRPYLALYLRGEIYMDDLLRNMGA